jgi:hypothetical protein
MTEETNVVAIYPDHDSAEQAVSKLRDASFDVTKLSIIGKDYHTDERSRLGTGGGPSLAIALSRRVTPAF